MASATYSIKIEKRTGGDNYWIAKNGKELPGQHYASKAAADAEMRKMEAGTSRFATA